MTDTLDIEMHNPWWGKALAAITVITAIIVATVAIVSLGSGLASASPHFVPQKSDFVAHTTLCSGEVPAGMRVRIAEFSTVYQGAYDADLALVEFIGGNPKNAIDGTVISGVDDKLYTSNVIPLRAVTRPEDKQSAMIRVVDIRPDQEFGVFARWSPDGDWTELARWKGNEKNKCGDPLAMYASAR